jgi:osomolarity two-component system, sensor histidine kinase SLN1
MVRPSEMPIVLIDGIVKSNACKFTPQGGRLTISTRLILPSAHPPSESVRKEDVLSQACINEPHSLSMHNLSLHNLSQAPSQPLDSIVVRIEVTDTGCGIKAEDMIHSKLFCE